MNFLVDGGRRHRQKENRYLYKSSQVKLLITNTAFFIVQRATALSEKGFVVIMV
jgi:hypothetical protein